MLLNHKQNLLHDIFMSRLWRRCSLIMTQAKRIVCCLIRAKTRQHAPRTHSPTHTQLPFPSRHEAKTQKPHTASLSTQGSSVARQKRQKNQSATSQPCHTIPNAHILRLRAAQVATRQIRQGENVLNLPHPPKTTEVVFSGKRCCDCWKRIWVWRYLKGKKKAAWWVVKERVARRVTKVSLHLISCSSASTAPHSHQSTEPDPAGLTGPSYGSIMSSSSTPAHTHRLKLDRHAHLRWPSIACLYVTASRVETPHTLKTWRTTVNHG